MLLHTFYFDFVLNDFLGFPIGERWLHYFYLSATKFVDDSFLHELLDFTETLKKKLTSHFKFVSCFYWGGGCGFHTQWH